VTESQFFFRTPDNKVDQYLKLFTLVPLDRIEEVMNAHMVGSSNNIQGKVSSQAMDP